MLFAHSQKDRDTLRRVHVRQLFVVRCPVQRTANDVLNFFLWLRQRGPDLTQVHLQHELESNNYGVFLSDNDLYIKVKRDGLSLGSVRLQNSAQ